jgi:WD40 repeat protein
MTRNCLSLAVLLLPFAAGSAIAQPAPSYSKDIQPFFLKYCVECHNAKKPRAGLNLETYKALQEGSDNGPVFLPGQAEKSKLVLMVEGKKEPRMPPKEATAHPERQEVALLRAWVSAGAKGEDTVFKVVLPAIQSRVKPAPPVTALCWLPDGRRLVAGSYRKLIVFGPKEDSYLSTLHTAPGTVTALACSNDGKTLAVACGTPGTPATLELYALPDGEKIWKKPRLIPDAHADVIQYLAFSPDGKTLLTCGYDRQVKVWEVASAKERQALKEHSDAVYGAAYRPDGKLFATTGADRSVKVWEAATNKLLYTLGEATDWVYTVAWSPDGMHLAAGGVDKSIRVWQADEREGRVVQSVFAHQGPVLRLAYSTDGRTLYSLSEDRTLKAWDAAKMVEKKVYPPQPDAPLCLAVRPGKSANQIAVGRYDGALVLLDEKTGNADSLLPLKPQPPQVKQVTPDTGPRGQRLRLIFEGSHLNDASEAVVNVPGVKAVVVAEANRVQVDLAFPLSTAPGVYQFRLKNAAGASAPVSFTVDAYSAIKENGIHGSPGTGQKITLPATVVGTIERAGEVDYYQFEARAGDQLGVLIQPAAPQGKKSFTPFLQLTDREGNNLAQSTQEFLGFTFRKNGTYALGVRDRQFGGNPTWTYRLHLGEIPVVTAIFPLGIRRGTETDILVEGVHLGQVKSVHGKAEPGAAIGSKITLPLNTPHGTPLGNRDIVVGEFPEALELDTGTPILAVPGTANGRISKSGETDVWRFPAKKGQKLILEVQASRLGSPLDSWIAVLDAAGKPIPRALVRSQAKTYVTFRDHDSVTPNIRIEAWSEFAVNDYVYVGSELLKIRSLPTHPDADCIFFSARGRRTGFLDTTPAHLAKDEPMYKVSLHPPGTNFAENGFPVVTLYYRNDDGPAGFGRDSQLVFDPPADGEYLVQIGDTNGQGGSKYAYRLTVRSPRPNYNVSFTPTSPAVWKGGAVPINVTADRIDGYDGPIEVKLENVPPGFSAPPTTVPAGEESTTFALWADADARTPEKLPPLKLTAQAHIDGQVVHREVTGGLPKALDAADIVTTTAQPEVILHPGIEARLTVHIDRRKGFKGRVPLEVQGMPHGVKVLDIGLNGILINENETSRTIVFYCHPWVQPMNQPIVISARREGTANQYAARSVELKIVPAGK